MYHIYNILMISKGKFTDTIRCEKVRGKTRYVEQRTPVVLIAAFALSEFAN